MWFDAWLDCGGGCSKKVKVYVPIESISYFEEGPNEYGTKNPRAIIHMKSEESIIVSGHLVTIVDEYNLKI